MFKKIAEYRKFWKLQEEGEGGAEEALANGADDEPYMDENDESPPEPSPSTSPTSPAVSVPTPAVVVETPAPRVGRADSAASSFGEELSAVRQQLLLLGLNSENITDEEEKELEGLLSGIQQLENQCNPENTKFKTNLPRIVYFGGCMW